MPASVDTVGRTGVLLSSLGLSALAETEDGMARPVPRRSAIALGGVALLLVCSAGAGAAVSPAKTKCPAASTVNAALGQRDKAPTSQTTTYAKVCTYKGSGVVATRIQFQVDTASTFAAGEKAAAATGTVAKVKGLGKAAYATKAGGFLAVFLGTESIRITAPIVALSRLERLARALV